MRFSARLPMPKLARLYLVFGALQLNLRHMYNGDITMLINIGVIDPDQVINVLQERFGLDEYVARASLKVFSQWYQERAGWGDGTGIFGRRREPANGLA
jgi:hypothetical protein